MFKLLFFSFLTFLINSNTFGQVDLSYNEITSDLLSTLEEDVYPYMLGVMNDEEAQLFKEIEIRITDGISISPVSSLDGNKRLIEIDKSFLYLLYRISEGGYYLGRKQENQEKVEGEDFNRYLEYIYDVAKLELRQLGSKNLRNKVKPYWRWKGEDYSYDDKDVALYQSFRKRNMKHILTYIVAHEFSHHFLGEKLHSDKKTVAPSEIDADTYGIELTYRSGRYLLPSRHLWDFYVTVETLEDAKRGKVTNENAFCRSARLRGFVCLAMRDMPSKVDQQAQFALIKKEADSLLTKGDCNRDQYNIEMKKAEIEFSNVEEFRKSCDSLCLLGEYESIVGKYLEFEKTNKSVNYTRFRKASILHKLLLRLTDEYEQYDVAIALTNELIPVAEEWGGFWLSQYHWVRGNSNWYGKWLKTNDKEAMLLAKEDYLKSLANNNRFVNAHIQMYFLSCFEENAEQAIYHLENAQKYGGDAAKDDISKLIQVIKLEPEQSMRSIRNSIIDRNRTYRSDDD